MKRITATQYARALYEATKDAPHKDIPKVLSAFVTLLHRHKRSRLIPSIVKRYERHRDMTESIARVTVQTAHPLTVNARKAIESGVLKATGAQKVVLNEHIDERLLGGVRLQLGDTIYDGTIRARLNTLATTFTKH